MYHSKCFKALGCEMSFFEATKSSKMNFLYGLNTFHIAKKTHTKMKYKLQNKMEDVQQKNDNNNEMEDVIPNHIKWKLCIRKIMEYMICFCFSQMKFCVNGILNGIAGRPEIIF